MEDPKKPKITWWQPGMELFLKLSGWIGGPAILGVMAGKYLDQKYNTQPWLLLLCSLAAFIVSMAALIHISKKEIKRIDREMRGDRKDEDKQEQ